MPVTWPQWLGALAAAIAAHVLLALAIVVLQADRQSAQPATQTVRVSLAPLGDAPTAALPAPEAAATVAPEASSGDAPTAAPAPEPAEQAAAPEPSLSAQAEPQLAEQPTPESPPAEAQVAATDTVAPETAGPVVAPEVVDPVTVSPADTAAEPGETVTAQSPSDAAVETNNPDAEGRQASSGSQSTTQAGGRADETDKYVSRVRTWLVRNRSYPRQARELQYEGVVRVRFAVNREGEILEYEILESSGHELLDSEVEAMIKRAQPLPRMPDNLRRNRMDLILPIHFKLE